MHTTPKQWPARLTLLLCFGVLAVLVTQLPDPAQIVDILTGGAPASAGVLGSLATVQSMLVATAGLIAWLLVAWTVAVLVLGLAARLPGRGGRRARRLLPRIAPAALGRLVATAVGVSIIAGTAACAAPAESGPVAADASTATGNSSTAATTPPPAPRASAGAADGSITIDWPDPTTAPTTTAPTTTAPTTTAPTTTAPTTTAPTTTAPTSAASATATPTVTTPTVTTPTVTSSTVTSSTVTTTAPSATTPGTPEPEPPATPEPAPPPTTEPTPPPGSVSVQPGDSLWRIAAHTLGPDATDADIDNAWRAWYFTNHEVIGDDPDVIVPGQALVAPATGTQVRS